VKVNSFLAEGGDGFTVLRQGTDRLGGDVDLDRRLVVERAGCVPGTQRHDIAR
jgi:hypothetical protein